jgi:hypothetical protein
VQVYVLCICTGAMGRVERGWGMRDDSISGVEEG